MPSKLNVDDFCSVIVFYANHLVVHLIASINMFHREILTFSSTAVLYVCFLQTLQLQNTPGWRDSVQLLMEKLSSYCRGQNTPIAVLVQQYLKSSSAKTHPKQSVRVDSEKQFLEGICLHSETFINIHFFTKNHVLAPDMCYC